MRTETPVDREKLVTAICTAEANGPLANRDTLWKTVADLYNASAPEATITFSVVLGRVKKWGLEVKTPPGKKGRQPGTMTDEQKARMQEARKNRKPRAEKFKEDPEIVEHIAYLRTITPSSYLPIVDRIEKGSMKASIAWKCLECSGWRVSEVKQCAVKDCSHKPFRPYRGKPGEPVTDEELLADLDEDCDVGDFSANESEAEKEAA